MKQENGVAGIFGMKVGFAGKKKLSLFAALKFFLLLFTFDASYGMQQEYVLAFRDRPLGTVGHTPAVLHLKKALYEQNPEINVSDYRLKRIILVAKSSSGHGVVQLQVGPQKSAIHGVDGTPHDYTRNDLSTYGRVSIHNPFYDSWGPWQLYLWGKIKVRQVILVVERRKKHRYGWRIPKLYMLENSVIAVGYYVQGQQEQ